MCGRARCTLRPDQIARACNLDPSSTPAVQIDRFRPSYNVAPGAYIPVVRRAERDASGCGGGGEGRLMMDSHVIHCMKWGLIPSFTKKSEKPDHFRMFNARSESIKEKASFRRLIPSKRCLVAVEGFYEWKKDGSRKQPFYIHFKDSRPLVFAALYDSWTSSEGEILYTFTILTTRCSSALGWLHDRMPVILGNPCSTEIWLSDSVPKPEVLAPYEDPDLVWYPVSPGMGKLSLNGPECIKEIPLPSADNSISKLFSKKSFDNVQSKLDTNSPKVESPLEEEPVFEESEPFDDKATHGNDGVVEPHLSMESALLKSSVNFKEQCHTDGTEGDPCAEETKYSHTLQSVKKEPAETHHRCGAKRGSETGLSYNKFSPGPNPMKKKEKGAESTSAKQVSLHSYFGKK